MNLENESKEFLDFLVEHCEANKIEEINEDELEDLKEQFINEAIKIEDIEALLGDGKPNGKYTKFTLKDGTYVLYHPTIGLEYRAKDGSLLPHNWKTVKAMKKELVMAGMINESDNKKMIESLLFKIKAKYGYDNLKVDYENGVVTGADEDIKFDVSGDNDYIELIETLQRMLKFGDEEVNEAELNEALDKTKLIDLLWKYDGGKGVDKKEDIYKLYKSEIDDLLKGKMTYKEALELLGGDEKDKDAKELLKYLKSNLNEAQETNITTALREIANGNTGAGIEAFKSAFLDRLSLNQDFQRITSELK